MRLTTAFIRIAIFGFLTSVLLCPSIAASAEVQADLLVLMHDAGRIERYDLTTGQHVGTMLSGLPPSNTVLPDSDGRLLISTGIPGSIGTVLRFDPRDGGRLETLLDVPEGYGGRLHRATGMAWYEGDLLVASQGDGKVKRYQYPSGEWKADVAAASPGGMTQIVVHDGRLFIADYVAQAIRRASGRLDGSNSEIWQQYNAQSPWGLAFDQYGNTFWSTAANRILRSDGTRTMEWAGAARDNNSTEAGYDLRVPIGLTPGPDGLLYVASLQGAVSVWDTNASQAEAPVRIFDGPEMQSPISITFTTQPRTAEFANSSPGDVTTASADKVAFFESKIRPIFAAHCLDCHGPDQQEGGLQLDSRQGWEHGGASGPALVPGKPVDSLLIKAVQYADKDLRMPPDAPLSPAEVALLFDWVQQGAVDPRTNPSIAVQPTTDTWAEQFQQRLDWWSLKPLRIVEPPSPGGVSAVDTSTSTDLGLSTNARGLENRNSQISRWERAPVDQFILHDLHREGLSPAPAADPEVLLRRLCIVLTGLPPTPAQHTAFLKHWQTNAQSAYESFVEQLLNSPHFGERFARHWMDTVRYTDTYGYEWDIPAKGSHQYRDYLIRVFNNDIGYDTFLREQLAGDLLKEPRLDTELGINESLIGPMFYHFGEHRHGSSLQFNGVHQEMVNNKIDAFSKVFLATTVACARCHDHKLEAVSQRDYYALGAVFMTPRWVSRQVDATQKNLSAVTRLKQLRSQIRQEIAKRWSCVALDSRSWRSVLALPDGSIPETTTAKPHEITYPLLRLLNEEADIDTTWKALASEWSEARTARLKANAAFQVLADFAEPQLPNGWVTDGDGMIHGWVQDATPLIALEGEQVIAGLLPQGLHSHALSSKLPGALRMPPQHLVEGRFVSLQLAGGEFAGYLTLDENTFLNEGVAFLNQARPTWRSFADSTLQNGVTRVTMDFSTSSLNPNFPPRTGLAPGLANEDPGYDKRSWLSVTGIVAHDTAGTPQDTLDAFASLYEIPTAGQTPATAAEAEKRINLWLSEAVDRWCREVTQPGDLQILDWLLSRQLLPNLIEPESPLSELLTEYRHIEQAIEFPRTVNSMDERQVDKAGLHFNVRGNVDTLGELIMPDFLQMFSGRNNVADSSGSGRLQLAESLLHPEHPLTARVYVNRVWQWIFGTGIVTTPDDFGRLGDRPSHPELLDWLARDFIRQGWSTKQLVRQLVLSETFRQSGSVSPLAAHRDPDNRLRHHYSTRRMEAEVIRDSLLAVSGRLDATLYGRPINPQRLVQDGAKRLFSGPLDGHGRRSLYLTMSIMEPPKFLTAFDLPDLKLPSGKRNVTNVPAQSLLLLNDELVSTLAQYWAEQLVRLPHTAPEDRTREMFVTAFGRMPQERELQLWSALPARFAAASGQGSSTAEIPEQLTSTSGLMSDVAAWSQLAHTMFNAKEFIFYR